MKITEAVLNQIRRDAYLEGYGTGYDAACTDLEKAKAKDSYERCTSGERSIYDQFGIEPAL